MKYDSWGNLVCWLPIAIPQTLTNPQGQTYQVSEGEIKDIRSLAELSGTPVVIHHPNYYGRSSIISPDNPEGIVGIALGGDNHVRDRPDGGVEVQVKITDKETIRQIVSLELVEVSAGYITVNGYRQYNHLALLPAGWALNGRTMRVMLESNTIQEIEMTPEQLKELTTAIAQSLEASLVLESKKDDEVQASLEKADKEGYARGVAAARFTLIAESIGVEATDADMAKKEIIKKAFPEHTDESIGVLTLESISALADVAIPLLKKQAEPIAVIAPAAKSGAVDVILESSDGEEVSLKKEVRNRFASKRSK